MASLVEAADSGDRYDTLVSMRSILAQAIEDARDNGDTAHISAMVKQMSELTADIDQMDKSMRKRGKRSSLDRARAAVRG